MTTKLILAVCALAACIVCAEAQTRASGQLQGASLPSASNIQIQQPEIAIAKLGNQFGNLKTGPLADFYELVAQHPPKDEKSLQSAAMANKVVPKPDKLGQEIAAIERTRQ